MATIFGRMKRIRLIVLVAASLSLGPLVAQTASIPVAVKSPNQHLDAQTHQPIYRKTYSLVQTGPTDMSFKYNPEYANGVTWGIWYSNESMTDPTDFAQNSNFYRNRGGWGTEFLSANLLPKIAPKFAPFPPENWQSQKMKIADVKVFMEKSQAKSGALYAGLGMGMGFYGKGSRSNVSFNTVREDSGYTYLKSESVSIWGKLLYEKKARLLGVTLYPFVSISAGPRIFYTQQQMKTYLTLLEYESPSSNNAFTDVVFASEFSIGSKIKLNDVVSLFVSQSFWSSSDIELVDLNQSKFNGLAYDLIKSKISGNQTQLKIGFYIDLVESRNYGYIEQAKIDTVWHYEAQIPPPVDSMIYDSLTKTMVKVKYFTCPCCLTNSNVKIQKNEDLFPVNLPNNSGGKGDYLMRGSPIENNPGMNNSGSSPIWTLPESTRSSSPKKNSTPKSSSPKKLPAPSISAPKIKN